jgi:hypothetical protein
MSAPGRKRRSSLPPGIVSGEGSADGSGMRAAVLSAVAPGGANRLLADVNALDEHDADARIPALARLEKALGRDFADRLLEALSEPTGTDSR